MLFDRPVAQTLFVVRTVMYLHVLHRLNMSYNLDQCQVPLQKK